MHVDKSDVDLLRMCTMTEKTSSPQYTEKQMFCAFIWGIVFMAVVAAIVMGMTHQQCEGLAGSYVQTMKNCIASHDFNSSWCMVGWLK
jgi:hypothetical protein